LTYSTVGLQRYIWDYDPLGRLPAGSLYYIAHINWDSAESNPSLTYTNPNEQVKERIKDEGTGSSFKGNAERFSIGYNNVPPRPHIYREGRSSEELKVQPLTASQVVNIRTLKESWKTNPQYVYIGRKNSRYGLRDSKWRNPYPLKKESEREQILAKFREYILSRPDLLGQLGELEGKILVCWCKPKPCHGDILMELLRQRKLVGMKMLGDQSATGGSGEW